MSLHFLQAVITTTLIAFTVIVSSLNAEKVSAGRCTCGPYAAACQTDGWGNGSYDSNLCTRGYESSCNSNKQVCGQEEINHYDPTKTTTPMACCGYLVRGNCPDKPWYNGYCQTTQSGNNYDGASCQVFRHDYFYYSDVSICAKNCRPGYSSYMISRGGDPPVYASTGTCIPQDYTGCGAYYINHNPIITKVYTAACPPGYSCSSTLSQANRIVACNPQGTACGSGTFCMFGSTCGSGSGQPTCYGNLSSSGLILTSCTVSSYFPLCRNEYERVGESHSLWSGQMDAIAPIIAGGNTETLGQTFRPSYDGYLTKIVIPIYKFPSTATSGIGIKIVEHQNTDQRNPGSVTQTISSEVDLINLSQFGFAVANFPLLTVKLSATKQYGIILKNLNNNHADIYQVLVSSPQAFTPAQPNYNYPKGTLAYYRVDPITGNTTLSSLNSDYDLVFNTYILPTTVVNTPITEIPTFGPWLKTTGGDVHANTNINTPGGP